MKEQHGIVINHDGGGSFADLLALENTPSACSVNLRRVGVRRVEQGAAFDRIHVGSIANVVTQAQAPPARGDSWSVDVRLKKGLYTLELRGWRNVAHGILQIFLDGATVAPAGGFDWCGPRTAEHVFRTAAIDVKWTGVHHLLGRTSRSSAELHRRERYWMRLRSLTFDTKAAAGQEE